MLYLLFGLWAVKGDGLGGGGVVMALPLSLTDERLDKDPVGGIDDAGVEVP